MASKCGIYIHIPFCKSKCFYCDFYSTVNTKYKQDYVNAVLSELKIRKNFLQCKQIESIYLGGGTPSILSVEEIEKIILAICNNFEIQKGAEITIEVNPDDITPEYAKSLFDIGINRISIGTQSFDDKALKFLGRRHNSKRNLQAIDYLLSAGFNNISIDLIYGLPLQDINYLQKSLNTIKTLHINHISAYHLTIEDGTVFGKLQQKGKKLIIDDDRSQEEYFFVINTLKEIGFEHYEISNFARNKQYSAHNSGYWFGMEYLGLGPSAHSYNSKIRCWNTSNLYHYLNKLKQGKTPCYGNENITKNTAYNDYIITRMRTSKGINTKEIESQFGSKYLKIAKKAVAKYSQNPEILLINNNNIILTDKGLFLSDSIMQDFIIV